MPFVGVYSGALALRQDLVTNVIMFRASIRANVASIIRSVTATGRRNFVLCVQNYKASTVWEDGVTAFIELGSSNYGGISPRSVIRFDSVSDNGILAQIQNGGGDALLLLCNASNANQIITNTVNNNVVYGVPNDVELGSLIPLLTSSSQFNPLLLQRIYACQSVPAFSTASSSNSLVNAYIGAINNTAFLSSVSLSTNQVDSILDQYGMEGYLVGSIITNVLQQINSVASSRAISDQTVSNRNAFLRALYDTNVGSVGGVTVGALTIPCASIQTNSCGCNQYARSTFMVSPVFNPINRRYEQYGLNDGILYFSGCGISINTNGVNPAAIAVPIAVSMSILLVTVIILVVVIILCVHHRSKMGRAPPTGTMVIAFTDIQSSTIIWQQYPQEMRKALKIHNMIIRKLLRRFNGYEVKTQGDSFMCAFMNPYEAVSWSLCVQEELLECTDWPAELIIGSYDCRMEWNQKRSVIFKGPRVRIGMHLGTAERIIDPVTNRPDFFGTTVNKAARVESCAHGGQILISQTLLRAVSSKLYNSETDELVCEERWYLDLTESIRTVNESSSSNRASSSHVATKKIRPKKYEAKVAQEKILYRSTGEHTLKGLSGKETLYEIFVPDLASRTFEQKPDENMIELDFDPHIRLEELPEHFYKMKQDANYQIDVESQSEHDEHDDEHGDSEHGEGDGVEDDLQQGQIIHVHSVPDDDVAVEIGTQVLENEHESGDEFVNVLQNNVTDL
ncbi:adenylate cyclase [Acrasis kona]|uniref:Adenylate cyclase n=1 Tax=Acrasis kona TaxID=1008807 RepID=A0AAW2ZQ25_9EUKA